MIQPDLTLFRLPVSSKKQLFELLAEQAAPLFFGSADAVLAALLERERLGPTAIGAGVALPHIQVEGIKRIYGVLACLETPVEYGAPDGLPVDVLYLLLAPAGTRTTTHLQALTQAARHLKTPGVCEALRAAAPDELFRAAQPG